MPAEPLAVAFANTRSSSGRDRLGTLSQWRSWVTAWPGLRAAGRRVDADGLLALRAVRDDAQSVLRSAAGGERWASAPLARLMALYHRPPSHGIQWRDGRAVLAVPTDRDAAAVIAHHLAHATLDLLLTGPTLRVCSERDCRKVFVASRPDRIWCSSGVCGNRTRVRAHRAQKRRTQSG
jgi:predicted RNA-binding Zn ribbon-like protein